jgi:hypothetical protein
MRDAVVHAYKECRSNAHYLFKKISFSCEILLLRVKITLRLILAAAKGKGRAKDTRKRGYEL